jgi:dTDP-4-amino-4,6-dideoxygalactose transaminase
VISDLLAAFLAAQLDHRDVIQASRRRIWERYDDGLADWAQRVGARQPIVPPHCEQAFHMYYLLAPTAAFRAGLIEHLKQRGILAVFHYLPLHLSTMGLRFGGRPGQCPVTEDAADRLVRLPFFTSMTEAEQDDVIAALESFSGG